MANPCPRRVRVRTENKLQERASRAATVDLASGHLLVQDQVRDLSISDVSTYLDYNAYDARPTETVTNMTKSTDDRLDEISTALCGLIASPHNYVTYKSLLITGAVIIIATLGGVWAINEKVVNLAVAEIKIANDNLFNNAKKDFSESMEVSLEQLREQISEQAKMSRETLDGSFEDLIQRLDSVDERLNNIVLRLGSATSAPQAPTEQPFTPVEPTEGEGTVPSMPSIFAVAEQTEGLQTLASALQASGFGESFSVEGPVTLFAPSDEAFSRLPDEVVRVLLSNPELLKTVLSYHVASGEITSEQITDGFPVVGIDGHIFPTLSEGRIQIDGANIIRKDIKGSDGIVHIIDRVLLIDQLR